MTQTSAPPARQAPQPSATAPLRASPLNFRLLSKSAEAGTITYEYVSDVPGGTILKTELRRGGSGGATMAVGLVFVPGLHWTGSSWSPCKEAAR